MPVKFAGTVRRERDSNPRTFWVNGFQDRRIRPLCHLSGANVRQGSFTPKKLRKIIKDFVEKGLPKATLHRHS